MKTPSKAKGIGGVIVRIPLICLVIGGYLITTSTSWKTLVGILLIVFGYGVGLISRIPSYRK